MTSYQRRKAEATEARENLREMTKAERYAGFVALAMARGNYRHALQELNALEKKPRDEGHGDRFINELRVRLIIAGNIPATINGRTADRADLYKVLDDIRIGIFIASRFDGAKAELFTDEAARAFFGIE